MELSITRRGVVRPVSAIGGRRRVAVVPESDRPLDVHAVKRVLHEQHECKDGERERIN